LLFEKVIAAMLISTIAAGVWLSHSFVKADTSSTSDFWLNIARTAWGYYEPGIGVDPQTGLPRSNVGGNEFTDWDLGVYIQAILDAQKLGILSPDGEWGANDRLEKIFTFLEHRPLAKNGVPYLIYYASTGKNATVISQVATDAGALFVSLRNIQVAEPHLKGRIDNIIYNITNYEPRKLSMDKVLSELQAGTREPVIYDYYVACGFAYFWPERFIKYPTAILDIIMTRSTVDYYGIKLPAAKITCEPLLLSIFNLEEVDQRILNLSRYAYLAQEMRYNVTGKYTAFSEGGTDCGYFIWEWIIKGDGSMWIIQTGDSNDVNIDLQITPVVYFKAAIGLLAIYNTAYTQDMVSYLLGKISRNSGFGWGITEDGNPAGSAGDFGNGLIVSAARYAVTNNITVLLNYTEITSGAVNLVTSNPGTSQPKEIADVPQTLTSLSTNTPAPNTKPPPTTVAPAAPNQLQQPTITNPTEGSIYIATVSMAAALGLAISYRVRKRNAM